MIIKSENEIVTLYVDPDRVTKTVEITAMINLPGTEVFPARHESFHFVIDSNTAIEFARALLPEKRD